MFFSLIIALVWAIGGICWLVAHRPIEGMLAFILATLWAILGKLESQ